MLLKRMLTNPQYTGAVIPSSSKLARCLAKQALPFEHAVELGAGTGAVTKALTQLSFKELQIVERDPKLVACLQRKFPQLCITEADAADVVKGLSCITPFALVSSLPFKSLPADVGAQTILEISKHLQESPGSILIQYTYGLGPPFRAPRPLEWRRVATIWANVPCAFVWTLQRNCQEK